VRFSSPCIGRIAVLMLTFSCAGYLPGDAFATTGTASEPSCTSSYDPYTVSQATLERCGDTVYPLASKTVATASHAAVEGANPAETIGATTYTYDFDGAEVYSVTPSAGFDAATASAAQLRDYGVPEEPSKASEPEAWQKWDEMVHNLKFVQPPSRLISIPVTASYQKSNNWSGVVDTPVSGISYDEAVTQFIQPTPEYTPCTPNAAVFWAGIGGDWHGSQTLTQDGTSVDVAGLGQNQGWWEILPAGLVAVPWYATAGNGTFTQAVVAYQLNDQWSMTLYNQSTGAMWASGIKDGPIDAQTAEYIAERPRYGDYEGREGLPGLTKYGYMKFTVSETNSKNMYEYPNESVQMEQGSTGNLVSGNPGDILASTQEYWGTGGFTDVARGCN
jgi:hypothetical protein